MMIERKAILLVEATFGVFVERGQLVRAGEKLGIGLDMRTAVLAPFDGVVCGISFDPERHAFAVDLSERAGKSVTRSKR